MEQFDVKAFQQRVQQARTPNEYQQLKQELFNYVSSLSSDDKIRIQRAFKPVWSELNGRVDKLIAQTEELNRPTTA